MTNLTCKTCGITIRWQATMIGSELFCCIGCAYGGPCTCDYDRLPHSDDHAALVIWKDSKMEISVHIIQER